jgi:putative DNA primase/helicase
MDAANKDSILLAIRHWIVEIGELDSSFKKDVARLKGFITNDRDKLRLPYDRKESNYQRRTVFCATVNASEYLVDTTGNSRFWTIPCKSINYGHDIDMQQLWTQVYHEFKNNPEFKNWWLAPHQEEGLKHFNQNHCVVNAVSDLLSSQLDFDAEPLRWRKMSASELLKDVGIDKPSNGQSRECGAFLREHCGEPRKIKGYMSWNVPPLKGSWSPYPKPAKKHSSDDDEY